MVEVKLFTNKNGRKELTIQSYSANESEIFRLKDSKVVRFAERVFLERKSPDSHKEKYNSLKDKGLVQYKNGNIPVVNDKGYSTRRFVLDYLTSIGVDSRSLVTSLKYTNSDLAEPITYGEFAYILERLFKSITTSKKELSKVDIDSSCRVSLILNEDVIETNLFKYKQEGSYKSYWNDISNGSRALPYPVYKAHKDYFPTKSVVGEVPREFAIRVIEKEATTYV